MIQQENETLEHIIGIFASMLRHLPGGSAARIRTLAKFMEKDYEKIEKLVRLRRQYAARLSPVEKQIEEEKASLNEEDQEDMAGDWLSRRLDAGLFPLQVSSFSEPPKRFLELHSNFRRQLILFFPG